MDWTLLDRTPKAGNPDLIGGTSAPRAASSPMFPEALPVFVLEAKSSAI